MARQVTVAVAVVLALTSCGSDVLVGGPDGCPPSSACAPPQQKASDSYPDEAADVATYPLPPESVTEAFRATTAPDGNDTVPLSLAYLGPGESADRLIVRTEYPDLCQRLIGIHVAEAAEVVTLTAVGTAMSDVCPQRLLIATGFVVLDNPLGSRTVRVGP